MTEDEAAATEARALEFAAEFEALAARLRDFHDSIPVSPQEAVMLLGEEDMDFATALRSTIQCLLVDLLVEECHGALPFEPHRAHDVAKVAVDLGRLLSAQAADDPAWEETLCRALCLGSHADRLLGEHRKAEGLLVRAAIFTSDPA